MKYWKHAIGFFILSGVIIVCGSTFLVNTVRPNREIKSLMDQKIDEFHQRLIQEKFTEIYAEADSDLKSKYSEQEFTNYLKKARGNLGDSLPKANVDAWESLINAIRRKLGKKTYQGAWIEVSKPPNYKSEIFDWAIYSTEEIKLSGYESNTK